ncbi:flavonoid 3'-monooxygenase-like [Selaginella moellendorffii]|uniref:flavonoid 3'-monooxygenase-like n=1 Tax=Selaginella moellendorffii TaxID=88036 RepID=UPI000D1CD147|nr:flavonoid 3'-monooxygenase-like [Selaginella moellendorffii]|eukprot:XP_024528180.1 flavonoid 3'-monooxygenase-like [Selaginella moellendorffii]
MAKEFLKTHDAAFAHRPPRVSVEIAMYNYKSLSYGEGDYHKNIRRMRSMELFTAKRVTSFTKIIRDELVSVSTSGWSLGKRCENVQAATMAEITELQCHDSHPYEQDLLSSDDPEAREFVEVIDELLEAAGSFSLADYFPSISWLDWSIARCRQAHCKMDAFLDKVLS